MSGNPLNTCYDTTSNLNKHKPIASVYINVGFVNNYWTKLYRQFVGIPMGTNCAPFVADLLLFCYERDFMLCLSGDKEADIIAFGSTSRY